jgi:hypothetical protein
VHSRKLNYQQAPLQAEPARSDEKWARMEVGCIKIPTAFVKEGAKQLRVVWSATGSIQ